MSNPQEFDFAYQGLLPGSTEQSLGFVSTPTGTQYVAPYTSPASSYTTSYMPSAFQYQPNFSQTNIPSYYSPPVSVTPSVSISPLAQISYRPSPLPSFYSSGLAAEAMSQGQAPTDYIYGEIFDRQSRTLVTEKPEPESPVGQYVPDPGMPGAQLSVVGEGGVAGITPELLSRGIQTSIEISEADRIAQLQPDKTIVEMGRRGLDRLNANERATYVSSQVSEREKANQLDELNRNIAAFSRVLSDDILEKSKVDPIVAEKYINNASVTVGESKQASPTIFVDGTKLPEIIKDVYGVTPPASVTDPGVLELYAKHNSTLSRGVADVASGSYNPDRLTAFSDQFRAFRTNLDATLAASPEAAKLGSDNGVIPSAIYQNNPGAVLSAIDSEITRAKANGATETGPMRSDYLRNLQESRAIVQNYGQTRADLSQVVAEWDIANPLPDAEGLEKGVYNSLLREKQIIQSDLSTQLRQLSTESSGPFATDPVDIEARRQHYINTANQRWEASLGGLDETHKKGFLYNTDGRGSISEWNWDNIMAGSALLLSLYQGTFGRERDRKKQMEDMMKLERFRTDEALRLYGGRAEINAMYRGGGRGGGGAVIPARPQGPAPAGSASMSQIASSGGFG